MGGKARLAQSPLPPVVHPERVRNDGGRPLRGFGLVVAHVGVDQALIRMGCLASERPAGSAMCYTRSSMCQDSMAACRRLGARQWIQALPLGSLQASPALC